jgi:hypothetical protein
VFGPPPSNPPQVWRVQRFRMGRTHPASQSSIVLPPAWETYITQARAYTIHTRLRSWIYPLRQEGLRSNGNVLEEENKTSPGKRWWWQNLTTTTTIERFIYLIRQSRFSANNNCHTGWNIV